MGESGISGDIHITKYNWKLNKDVSNTPINSVTTSTVFGKHLIQIVNIMRKLHNSDLI